METQNAARLLLTLLMTTVSFLVPNAPAQAARGGANSAGGGQLAFLLEPSVEPDSRVHNDPRKIREEIERNTAVKLEQMLAEWRPGVIEALTSKLPPDLREFKKIISPQNRAALLADIRGRRYRFDEQAPSWKRDPRSAGERDALTRHERGAEIWFNLERISRYPVKFGKLKDALISLTFHEHVRHFQVHDDSHAVGKLAPISRDPDRISTFVEEKPGTLSWNHALLLFLRNSENSALRMIDKEDLVRIEAGALPSAQVAFMRLGDSFFRDYLGLGAISYRFVLQSMKAQGYVIDFKADDVFEFTHGKPPREIYLGRAAYNLARLAHKPGVAPLTPSLPHDYLVKLGLDRQGKSPNSCGLDPSVYSTTKSRILECQKKFGADAKIQIGNVTWVLVQQDGDVSRYSRLHGRHARQSWMDTSTGILWSELKFPLKYSNGDPNYECYPDMGVQNSRHIDTVSYFRLPKSTELQVALNHGLLKLLKTSAPGLEVSELELDSRQNHIDVHTGAVRKDSKGSTHPYFCAGFGKWRGLIKYNLLPPIINELFGAATGIY